ncbi:MAG: FAD:protein FMN transferase [Oscillospiraceae bacterium]
MLTACSTAQTTKTATRTEFLLDTFVTVTLYGSKDEAVLDGAMELCRYYDNILDRHNPKSLVSQLNRGQGPVEIAPELYDMLKTALQIGALSHGRYDITIAPVMDLWDFKGETGKVPDEKKLAQALALVGQENVLLLENHMVELKNGAQLDLGSIAKGFIADQMARHLREQKVPGAIVNLGGNVITVGNKPGNKPFVIGVQKPFGNRQEIVGSLEISDLSLVSAGLYERSFTGEDGVIYHHILDATNGMPAQTGLLSVSILSPSSTWADGLSTLCFLLGTEEAMQLVENMEDTEAIFLTADGKTLLSSGLVDRYQPVA